MKKTITLLALCLIGTLSFAQQAPAIQWQKCLGGTDWDYARCIQLTSDGGYIVAGVTSSNGGDVIGNHGNDDVWVVKLNSNGNLQWQKCLGGTDDERVNSIQPTTDGGYIIGGATRSINGDIIGIHGIDDAWIVKLSSFGAIQWQKCLGGTGPDYAQSIQSTSDGGYIVAGSTASNDGDVTGNHGGYDAWVVKINSSGSLQWQKTMGGIGNDDALNIQLTSDEGYIISGDTSSIDGDVSGNYGGYDAWVVKLSSTGSLQWQKNLGGIGNEYATSIQPTPDGGYIVASSTASNDGDVTGNHGSDDAWIVKLNSTGNLQWQKCLGGTNNDSVESIQLTTDGGYIMAGQTWSFNGDVSGNHGGSDTWIVKLSNTGSLEWQKCMGGLSGELAVNILITSDGGYIMFATTWSFDGDIVGNHGGGDYWVVKLAPELATSTFNNQALTLYPNPTKGLLQLQTPNNTSFNKIIITDSTGKTVLEQTQNTTQVNVEKLASGLYIIKAFSGEEMFVNKFVKE